MSKSKRKSYTAEFKAEAIKLAQDFTASKPNLKWVSDITYLMISKG